MSDALIHYHEWDPSKTNPRIPPLSPPCVADAKRRHEPALLF